MGLLAYHFTPLRNPESSLIVSGGGVGLVGGGASRLVGLLVGWRWCLVIGWFAAWLEMCLIGLSEDGVSAGRQSEDIGAHIAPSVRGDVLFCCVEQ